MNQPADDERIVEILAAARRPEGETTQETLEENLRWLVHKAMPQDKASEALRQRVQAMTAAHRTRRRPLLTRLVDFLILNRGPLLGAASAAALAVAFLLLLIQPTPADVLRKALDTMAQVRSAHCTGWYTTYRYETTAGGRPIPLRMNVEWWYKAPDRYRKERSGAESVGYMPYRLIVQGQRGVLSLQHGSATGTTSEIRDDDLTQYLSPLDFFSPEGIIRRAYREGDAHVTEHEETDHGRLVHKVKVEVVRQRKIGIGRQGWILTVDPSTNRILGCKSRLDCLKTNTWVPLEEETLDSFEYDIDVNDDLFQAELFSRPLSPSVR